ncbi:MAG: DUF2970 domain-containing protein [Gammaproteobacteria bacterium]|nr:DUF2970 domain-containing protein [Gammaproteobacteria bacterium]
MNNDKNKNTESVSFFQVFSSVMAAMFGVQTEKNRERDFNKGKLWHYVVGGIIFAVIFITILISVVQLALSDI